METWLINNLTENNSGQHLSPIAKDPLENLHLSFLKWNLGVGKKTSNAAVWGDCGRYPLVIELSKQVLNYYDRLKNMSLNNSDTLVKHAFNEQKSLNMNWFRRINTLSDHSKVNRKLNSITLVNSDQDLGGILKQYGTKNVK